MQSAEIEIKFPISDPAAFQSRLPALGFRLETPRTFEHNTLYDTRTRDLRERKEILRIRQYGGLCTVTHKRKLNSNEAPDSTRYKIRIETETAVAEGAALGAIFEQLGYTPAFVYDKYRSEWSHPINSDLTGHLVIDETPIGTWGELEGTADWIDSMLAELNIDHATCTNDSYGTLFLKWRQSTGSPAENLTFEEISAPALVSQ